MTINWLLTEQSVILLNEPEQKETSLDREPPSNQMPIQIRQHRWNQLLTQPGRHWILVALVLYVAACLLPAMKGPFDGRMLTGWECLMVWIIPWWWANPSILIAIILFCLKWSRASAAFGVVAVGLAVHCELTFLYDDGDIPIGCILWVISLQIITLNSLWQAWHDRKRRQERLSLLVPNESPTTSLRA